MRRGRAVGIPVRHRIDTARRRGEAKLDRTDPLASNPWERENTGADKNAVVELVLGFSVETLCRVHRGDGSDRDLLPPGTRVHVGPTANPTLWDIVSAARAYRREGFEPVPVIVARWFDRRTAVGDFLARLRGEADVREVAVIGADQRETTNPQRSALDALTTGLFDKYGVTRIGVAAYPDRDLPSASRRLEESVTRYNAWALCTDADIHFVTAPGTDVEAIVAWERSARRAGNRLPVRAGLVAPSALGPLPSLERICGVYPSRDNMDVRGAASLAGLAVTAPHRALTSLARHKRDDPGCTLQAPHFVTSEPLRGTALWLDAVLRGAFTLREQGGGFVVRLHAAG